MFNSMGAVVKPLEEARAGQLFDEGQAIRG